MTEYTLRYRTTMRHLKEASDIYKAVYTALYDGGYSGGGPEVWVILEKAKELVEDRFAKFVCYAPITLGHWSNGDEKLLIGYEGKALSPTELREVLFGRGIANTRPCLYRTIMAEYESRCNEGGSEAIALSQEQLPYTYWGTDENGEDDWSSGSDPSTWGVPATHC